METTTRSVRGVCLVAQFPAQLWRKLVVLVGLQPRRYQLCKTEIVEVHEIFWVHSGVLSGHSFGVVFVQLALRFVNELRPSLDENVQTR